MSNPRPQEFSDVDRAEDPEFFVRYLDRAAQLPDVKTGAFNRSATPPSLIFTFFQLPGGSSLKIAHSPASLPTLA
jgi:hypothetical protein